MNKKMIRQRLIPIVFITLLVFVILTYTGVKRNNTPKTSGDISIEIIPDYKIISGKDLSLWPKNTEFDQGMAAYFYAADPVVTVTPTIRINGIWQGKINGTIQSAAEIRAVNDRSEVYWSYRISHTAVQKFTLSEEESDDNGQNSYTASDITFHAAAVNNQAAQIGKELMFRNGTLLLSVTSDIDITGIVNGSAIHKTIRLELPLTLQQESFTLPKTQDAISQISISEDSSPTLSHSVISSIRSHMFLFTADAVLTLLLLLLISVSAEKTGKEIEHSRYKEWITEGAVEIKDKLAIHILKLEGLVDLAIDLDKRVIYDARRNQYYVLTEDIVYVYDPERSHSMLENKTQLGKLLLEQGLLQPEQLEIGLHYQKLIGSRLGESLTALGFIDETTLYGTLAAQQKVNYYELEPEREMTDLNWLDRMSLQKARTLMSLPIGVNSDGRRVIASSETSREGVRKALQELFGKEIILVAARPSAINEAFNRLEKKLNDKSSQNPGQKNPETAFTLLTAEEVNQFITSYGQGRIRQELLLKAAGLTDTVNGEIKSLLNGLDKSLSNMDYKDRQKKQLPGLTQVLCNANYITPDTARSAEQEYKEQGISAALYLKMNLLASEVTIRQAEYLLSIIEKIFDI